MESEWLISCSDCYFTRNRVVNRDSFGVPMLNDEDKAALFGLLARYVRLWDENDADKKMAAMIQARLASQTELFAKLRSAFSIYGYQTTAVGDFDRLRADLGQDLYAQAMRAGGRQYGDPASSPLFILSMSDPKQIEQQPVEEADEDEAEDDQASRSIRDLVLERLKSAAPRGLKASEIRGYIEALRETQLHEKTVGMTLYRLSLDRLVRREGRIWFYVPQDAETKNPGGDTPGPSNTLL